MLDQTIRPPQGVEIRRMSGGVGAEILGIDVSEDHPEAVWRFMRDVINEYGVIFFRDQKLTPQQHVDFSSHFGEVILGVHNTPTIKEHPLIMEVRKEPEQKNNVGGSWHTDQSYRDAPIRRTCLLARETPAYGGDTMFMNMAAVYDSLSDGLKKTLDGLTAVHSNAKALANRKKGDAGLVDPNRPVIEVRHPVVVRHEDTGQKLLYVNPGHTVRIDGWTDQESAGFLGFLYQYAASKAEFQCRFHWEEGSIAIWDNIHTWHYAINDYHGERRVMHRTWCGRAKVA